MSVVKTKNWFQGLLSKAKSKQVNYSRYLTCAAVVGVMTLAVAEPALAQSWTSKIKTVTDEGVSGLKAIGSGVALICLLWSAYQIIWGGKRLQDMVPWFIGAILAFAADDIVKLFFS